MDPRTVISEWLDAETPSERREWVRTYSWWIGQGGFPAQVGVGDASVWYDVVRLTEGRIYLRQVDRPDLPEWGLGWEPAREPDGADALAY